MRYGTRPADQTEGRHDNAPSPVLFRAYGAGLVELVATGRVELPTFRFSVERSTN